MIRWSIVQELYVEESEKQIEKQTNKHIREDEFQGGGRGGGFLAAVFCTARPLA